MVKLRKKTKDYKTYGGIGVNPTKGRFGGGAGVETRKGDRYEVGFTGKVLPGGLGVYAGKNPESTRNSKVLSVAIGSIKNSPDYIESDIGRKVGEKLAKVGVKAVKKSISYLGRGLGKGKGK